MSEAKIENLRFIRIFTPIHIPKYLVDQVRDRDYTVDEFYKFQEAACVKTTQDGISLNPLNHLYILANEENVTKGFVWFIVDPLGKDLVINTFSMDKEYWGNGKAVKLLAEFIKGIQKKAKLKKVYWITNYEKHSKRYGFKRSKSVLMEYKEEEDGQNISRGDAARRDSRSADTGATTILKRDHRITPDRTTSEPSVQPVLAAV